MPIYVAACAAQSRIVNRKLLVCLLRVQAINADEALELMMRVFNDRYGQISLPPIIGRPMTLEQLGQNEVE